MGVLSKRSILLVIQLEVIKCYWSLKINQNFADLTNAISLVKTGKINNLNLTILLKSNLLDEDGFEDAHFYFVSFNQHKAQILSIYRISVKNNIYNIIL